jgi:hypothetical protein
MKMKKPIAILLAAICALGLSSCKKKGCTDEQASNYSADAKKDDGSCTYDSYTADFSSYYADNRTSATQNFTIDPTIWNSITGDDGIILQFPANSFVDGGGTPVTANVDISLIEVMDQSDMILLNASTTSNDEILVSGGSMNVTATSGGNQVFLDAGVSVNVMVPYTISDPNMGIFNGSDNSDGAVNWTTDTTTLVDTLGWYTFGWADSDLGWINCDYFSTDPNPKSDLDIYVDGPALHTYENTEVLMHFSSINSVAKAYGLTTNTDKDQFVGWNVPETTAMTLVVISEVDGQYYSAFQSYTVESNGSITVTLTATTESAFETAVNAL